MMQFPITRQHNVIEKVAAALMRKRSAGAADRCVGAALRKFTDEMRRQGIPQATVKREVRLMEALIRAAVWRLMFPWVNDEQVRTRRRRRQTAGRSGSAASANQLSFAWNRR